MKWYEQSKLKLVLMFEPVVQYIINISNMLYANLCGFLVTDCLSNQCR